MANKEKKFKTSIEVGLNAAIVDLRDQIPQILIVLPTLAGVAASLPAGLFNPLDHRTMEMGLRSWVRAQTGLRLGYVEQLYTFGDRGRHARPGDVGAHVMSVGYVALTRVPDDVDDDIEKSGTAWRSWYDFFPWEDWRGGRPTILDRILPLMKAWRDLPVEPRDGPRSAPRRERVHSAFGRGEGEWDDERVLDRYELLYEAGLVSESARDGRDVAARWGDLPPFGEPLQYDHRRILATAISRLRGKIKYRPVIFELMAETFTLTQLQQAVESISGRHLHKQNFRRLVTRAELVEPTGAADLSTGGRPAALFRYRGDVTQERTKLGLRL